MDNKLKTIAKRIAEAKRNVYNNPSKAYNELELALSKLNACLQGSK